MKLTGKCKDDFEKWFRPNVPLIDINIFNHRTTPFSMQYGVYVDFFDRVRIQVKVEKEFDMDYAMYTGDYAWICDLEKLRGQDGHIVKNGFTETLKEARKKAIEKANEIYNESNFKI
jgi:hypothetical protein